MGRIIPSNHTNNENSEIRPLQCYFQQLLMLLQCYNLPLTIWDSSWLSILCSSNTSMFSLNLQGSRLWTDPPCKLTQANKISYYSRTFHASGKFIWLCIIFCREQLNNLDSFYLSFSTDLIIANSNFLICSSDTYADCIHQFILFLFDIKKHPCIYAKVGLNRIEHNISPIVNINYVRHCLACQFSAEFQASISMVNLKQMSSDIFSLLQARFQYFWSTRSYQMNKQENSNFFKRLKHASFWRLVQGLTHEKKQAQLFPVGVGMNVGERVLSVGALYFLRLRCLNNFSKPLL